MAVVITLYAGFCTPGDDYPMRPARNRATLLDLLHRRHPDGFTVLDGIGCWQGQEEPGASVIFIEEGGGAQLHARVLETARTYKRLAQQDEVWVTRRDETLAVV